MARKGRETLTEAPPPAAAASGSDSDTDSDEYESSSEDEGDHQTQLSQQPPKKPDPPNNPRDSDTGSDSDTDSDPKPTPSEEPKSKATCLPTPLVSALAAVSNKRKNANADTSGKGLTAKKAKKDKSEPSGSTPVVDEGGKKLFQRLWSDDDEIVILKGLIEFRAKKGKDPMSDVDGFLDFIKSSLHVADVRKEQIVSKIRRLKIRYQNAKKRTLTNPHELNAFVLSKSIWGGSDDDENDNGMNVKSKVNKTKSKASNVKNVAVNGGVSIDGGKKVEEADEKIKGVEGNAASGGGGVVMTMSVSHGIQLPELNKFGDVDEKFMNEGLKLLNDDKRDELEEEWRNYNIAQMEGLVKRFELYHKTSKSLLNAVKCAKP